MLHKSTNILFQSSVAGLAVLTLSSSLSMAAIPEENESAQEESKLVVQQNVAPLPVVDLRDRSSMVAMQGAASSAAELNAMIIVYSGDDSELQRKVFDAANRARSRGVAVSAMAIVRENPDIGSDMFVVYSNDAGRSDSVDPSIHDIESLVETMTQIEVHIYRPSIEREQGLSASNPF